MATYTSEKVPVRDIRRAKIQPNNARAHRGLTTLREMLSISFPRLLHSCSRYRQHRGAGPNQVEEIERGDLPRRIWGDICPNDARSGTQRDQAQDGGEFPMYPGCGAVAAL